ncbi:MAG: hypothetical protein Kilf2KO_07960 [Rhodospirillales bacterium]
MTQDTRFSRFHRANKLSLRVLGGIKIDMVSELGTMMARVKERDLVIPALRAAARSPGGRITTSKLIELLTDEFQPDGRDSEIIPGRQDTYFSQKVRNLVSHRESSSSMFSKGYADYLSESESICITQAGTDFLAQVIEE